MLAYELNIGECVLCFANVVDRRCNKCMKCVGYFDPSQDQLHKNAAKSAVHFRSCLQPPTTTGTVPPPASHDSSATYITYHVYDGHHRKQEGINMGGMKDNDGNGK